MKLNVMLIGLPFGSKSASVWYLTEVELEDICFINLLLYLCEYNFHTHRMNTTSEKINTINKKFVRL